MGSDASGHEAFGPSSLVVPLQFDSCADLALPVDCDLPVLGQCCAEVFHILLVSVLDAKVVDHEGAREFAGCPLGALPFFWRSQRPGGADCGELQFLTARWSRRFGGRAAHAFCRNDDGGAEPWLT